MSTARRTEELGRTGRSACRRRSRRLASVHRAEVYSRDGRLLARGKTGNISEHGIFVVAKMTRPPVKDQKILITLHLPEISARAAHRPTTRTVQFRARIVRIIALGQLVGLGIELEDSVS